MNLEAAADALDARLINDWRSLWHKFWTIRIALFWGAVSGLLVVWPSFAGAVPLPVYAAGSVVMTALLAVARLTKQPGVD
jgi:hypothetical protein